MKICPSLVVLAAALSLSACQTPPASPAKGAGLEAPTPSDVFALSDVDTAPERLSSRAFPAYPKMLLRDSVSGVAHIQFIVLADGSVVQVRALRATHPLFAESAIAYASKLKFKPALKNGVPVAARMEIPINFNLTGDVRPRR
jgi:TonB family protein